MSRQDVNFWSSLTFTERSALTLAAAERTFVRGARLMTEGAQATEVMVILSGRTQVTVRDGKGERVLAERGAG